MTDRNDERTLYEAIGDVRYGARYFHLQGRLFAKIDGLLKLITLIAGSSAFAGYIAQDPDLAGMSALLTAGIAALDHVIDPGAKKSCCVELYKRYTELERDGRKMPLDELDDRIYELRLSDAPSIEALRVPAYNQAAIERGRPTEKLAVTRWQRFMAWLA